MSKAIVYQVGIYNPDTNKKRISGRWMTREGLEHVNIPGGVVIEGTATEVDACLLDIDGLSDIGFNPSA